MADETRSATTSAKQEKIAGKMPAQRLAHLKVAATQTGPALRRKLVITKVYHADKDNPFD